MKKKTPMVTNSRFLSVWTLRLILCLALCLAMGLGHGSSGPASPGSAPYRNPRASVKVRVADLMSRLTQAEKIELLSGTGFATRAIPRLGIPPMNMVDAPQGVRGGASGTLGKATLFPSGVAMAATWDPALIRRMGAALGEEARGKGTGADVLLGPCIDIHRSPQGGRNTESFSEDPYLTSRIAVGYIQGVQSTGTAACVKHYACNNEETDRGYVDVRVSERALREIYLPGFQAAVQQGHAWALMASYNQVNGYHATANHHLLTDILKKDWGFDGLVMSDWGAVHETAGVLNAGNDLEMPGGEYLTPDKVTAAVEAGQIAPATIDLSVQRILRAIIRTGLLDGPKARDPKGVDSPAHRQLAYKTATRSIVLLKNAGGLLPLDSHKIRSIAVIGPNAAVERLGGRGSATVIPFIAISPLAGLIARAGPGVKIRYVQGTPLGSGQDVLPAIPSSALTPTGGAPNAHGLRGEYFANRDLSGAPVLTRADSQVDFDWHGGSPASGVPAANFSARWTGNLVAPTTGKYTLGLNSDDGSRLFVNGKLLIDNEGEHAAQLRTASLDLTAGHAYPIRIEFFQAEGESSVRFGWIRPSDKNSSQFSDAVAAAAQSDVVIVFAGISEEFEGEGLDRADLHLPGAQDALIRAVAKANRHTIVVLNSGTPILMNAWIKQVPAVLQSWYPGEEGGRAIAAILFGDVDPSGRLPDTYALSRRDYPDWGHFPGSQGMVDYTEGIYVGYRHFDKAHIAPLYPFGYGLSYTTFHFGPLRFPATLRAGQTGLVRLRVQNTGRRAGAEVVQLYVRDLAPKVDRPVRELKSFAKIALKPGESTVVSLPLDARAFAYYDVGRQRWQTNPGRYEIAAGASSRDLRATGIVTIR